MGPAPMAASGFAAEDGVKLDCFVLDGSSSKGRESPWVQDFSCAIAWVLL